MVGCPGLSGGVAVTIRQRSARCSHFVKIGLMSDDGLVAGRERLGRLAVTPSSSSGDIRPTLSTR